MDNLRIVGNKDLFFIPDVDFNAETGICKLGGESYLENAYKFYQPLVEWIKNYTSTGRPIKFECSLAYFNTGSSKYIVELLSMLKDYEEEGGIVQAIWRYDRYHIEMIEEVEDFMIESDLDIKMIPFN